MPKRYVRLMKLDDAAFRRITGTKQFVFGKMLVIVHFFITCNTNKAAHPIKSPLADYGINRSTLLRIIAK
ncbi:MAG: hypothetical protein LBT46_06230 [Planctomycetaceae bacterium]|nr:hypothetical protein [Planctomycetaceae bacterium]